MFATISLDYKANLFSQLLQQTDFEDITKGRKGSVLVDVKNDITPIVRTTTKYNKLAQKFKLVHYDIMKKIREKSNIPNIWFNNALIELYDRDYCTMGFHSDQALDLSGDSYIAVYSCYENPHLLNKSNSRKLIVKNKKTNKENNIIMEHDSVIIFDILSNQQHLHKIILDNNNDNNRWLGITFRLSKTFIQHINDLPYFYKTDKILRLANDEEVKNFYKLRSEENKSSDFKYPEMDFTISASDLMLSK